MSEVYIHALIKPKAGQSAKAAEVLTQLAAQVQAKEPNCLRYTVLEETSTADGQPILIVEEIYKSEADADAHNKTDYFTSSLETLRTEALLEGPPTIKRSKVIGGFALRA